MRFLQIPGLAAFGCFLTGLVNATTTNTSSFAGLLDALGDLGYDGKSATAFGALDHLLTAIAPGAGGSCARAVRLLKSTLLLTLFLLEPNTDGSP